MVRVSLAKPLSDFLRVLHGSRARGERAIDVFADLLSIDQSKELEVVIQLSHITFAIDKLRLQVHSLDGWDTEFRNSTLESINKIYNIFNVANFGTSFGSVVSAITDSDLVMLSLLDKVLCDRYPVPRISSEDIHEFQKKIDELIAEINASSLSASAKILFSTHLAGLRIAFDQYKYFGVEAAWRHLALMTADLARRAIVEPVENRGILIRAKLFGKSVLKLLSVAEQVNSGVLAIENLSSRLPGAN